MCTYPDSHTCTNLLWSPHLKQSIPLLMWWPWCCYLAESAPPYGAPIECRCFSQTSPTQVEWHKLHLNLDRLLNHAKGLPQTVNHDKRLQHNTYISDKWENGSITAAVWVAQPKCVTQNFVELSTSFSRKNRVATNCKCPVPRNATELMSLYKLLVTTAIC